MVERSGWHSIGVGKVYPGLPFPVAEIGEYNYLDTGHELRLFYPRPTASEIEAAKSGEPEFGLLVEEGVIFFLYRFGGSAGIPWSDAPFSVHLVPEDRRQTPPEDYARALLTVCLADAASGIVKSLRAVSLSQEFTRALHEAIRDQDRQEFSSAGHDATIARVYQRYSRTTDMLSSAPVRTKGGV